MRLLALERAVFGSARGAIVRRREAADSAETPQRAIGGRCQSREVIWRFPVDGRVLLEQLGEVLAKSEEDN